MRDHRAESLAQILVQYSTKVQEGDTCIVSGTSAAEPLLLAVYEEVIRAGGLPIVQMTPDEAAASFFRLASDAQLDWVAPPSEWAAEHSDVRIAVMADSNSRALSSADPKKQARAQKARRRIMETTMRRAAEGKHRWALTLFPTHAHASEAGMSLSEYEDFYCSACLATDADPVTASERRPARSTGWPSGWAAADEVHITAPGTDVKLGVAGRKWIPCSGHHNMPDGEFFTGPVEDAVEGEVSFSFPAT